MEPIVLIHGYIAESSETTPEVVRDIYGTFPDALRENYGSANVIEIDVSLSFRWKTGLRSTIFRAPWIAR